MSFKERFNDPPDTPNPPCCDDCDKEICIEICDTLKKVIEDNDKAIRDLEESTGWPEHEY